MYAAASVPDSTPNRQETPAKAEDGEKAGRQSEDNGQRVLLSFELQHAIAGRLRLKVSDLQFNDKLAGSFVNAAQSIDGVQSVRANSWCGSVIINFDSDAFRKSDCWRICASCRSTFSSSAFQHLP